MISFHKGKWIEKTRIVVANYEKRELCADSNHNNIQSTFHVRSLVQSARCQLVQGGYGSW